MGSSVALLIYNVRPSSEGTSGSVWLTLLMSLVLFVGGMPEMRKDEQ